MEKKVQGLFELGDTAPSFAGILRASLELGSWLWVRVWPGGRRLPPPRASWKAIWSPLSLERPGEVPRAQPAPGLSPCRKSLALRSGGSWGWGWALGGGESPGDIGLECGNRI